MFKLTKTNFIQYLNCSKSLWLLKNKPEEYPSGEFSLFLEKLIKEGYEVEDYAQQLFPNGIKFSDFASSEITENQIKNGGEIFFQPAFETSKGVFSRIDVLEKKKDGTWHIYEVKSSTKIKTDKKHNHLKDVCFQKYTMLENGYEVSQVSIIYLNKDYIRNGDVNPKELLIIEDVTEKIDKIYSTVVNQINEAVNYINKEEISFNTCVCRENTRSNHCDSFKIFNTDILEYSIYEIGNIRDKKIKELLDMDVLLLKDIPSDYSLNDKQLLQIKSTKQGTAIINEGKISNKLSNLKFPLHFIDYETYASAVPKTDGLKPHQHVPFQVSIHSMQEDGKIKHFEFLADKLEFPEKLIQYMEESTGNTGTYISWHASFEISRNKDMVSMLPHHIDYLENMNNEMFDLEDIFKIDYVDYQFHGSTSIKKVLPIIVPKFSYSELEVQNGTMALDTWGRMVLDKDYSENKEIVRKNLLDYCELDTLAMVEIYKKLLEI